MADYLPIDYTDIITVEPASDTESIAFATSK